jgi:hypothetical protein
MTKNSVTMAERCSMGMVESGAVIIQCAASKLAG